MSSVPSITDRVTVQTPCGDITGRVVGIESRPTSRNGDGPTRPFVCVALDQVGAHSWQWIPAAAVTTCTPDPDRQVITDMVQRLGAASVATMVMQA